MTHPRSPFHRDIDPALRELARTGQVPVLVRGACMTPWIADAAAVQFRAAERCWPGDILVVRGVNGRLLIHRLLGVYPTRQGLRYLTQGDHSGRPDAAVPRSAILGRLAAGHCDPIATHPPFAHRVRSLAAFARFMGVRATGLAMQRLARIVSARRRAEVPVT